MLKRERFVNKLRELGYKFKKETPATHLYRCGTHPVFVPKTDLLTETYVRITLQTCNCGTDEIEAFVRAAKV